ncbi:hypothetical protein CPC16_009361 [Podila verticillata]|nr:hypothetical protein BGZ52_010104 [Haplosporangium bisporale]KAF9215635.1 hypothetical protein BGZ59_000794 [Podila verticillata]KAF9382394.1 hypothetical protein CPC16_009361 [Podila verticillata]
MSSLRTVSNALPRISMARIPLVAFTNNPATLTSPSNNAHPSSFSSMAANQKDSSSWSKSAKNVAGKLEHSAKKMAKEDKDYLREVKQYDCPEDEVLMELGLARSSAGSQAAQGSEGEHGSGFSKGFLNPGVGGTKGKSSQGVWTYTNNASGFEQTIMDQVQADVVHPSAKPPHHQHHKHAPEMVSSLCQELKAGPSSSSSASSTSSKLSSYASDAIRMVESHNILKHDRAPIHDMRDEDPSQHRTNIKIK